MEVWATKVIVLVILLIVTMLAGLIPLKLFDYVNRPNNDPNSRSRLPFMALLNCFAGGVFLGTLMLHLQPHLHELTTKAALSDSSLPMAEILTAAGLFFILFIEQIFVHISNRQQTKEGTISPGTLDTALEDISDEQADTMLSTDDVTKGYGSTETNEIAQHIQNTKNRRVILLIFALSVHSLFEGLAIGLQDSKSLVWTMFVAIAFHKSIISFSTGVQLVKTYQALFTPVAVGIFVFSIMSPFGTAIGTLVQTLNGLSDDDWTFSLVILILQGITARTFMFIAFFEILVKNLRSSGAPLWKTLAVLLGFTCLFVILLFDEHEG